MLGLMADLGLMAGVATIDNGNVPQSGWVAVKAGAPWCGYCRKMTPEFQAASNEVLGVQFYEMNIDISENYHNVWEPATGAGGVPDLMLFNNGRFVGNVKGALSKAEIIAWINTKTGGSVSGNVSQPTPIQPPTPSPASFSGTCPIGWSFIYLDGKPACRNPSTGEIRALGAQSAPPAAPKPAPTIFQDPSMALPAFLPFKPPVIVASVQNCAAPAPGQPPAGYIGQGTVDGKPVWVKMYYPDGSIRRFSYKSAFASGMQGLRGFRGLGVCTNVSVFELAPSTVGKTIAIVAGTVILGGLAYLAFK